MEAASVLALCYDSVTLPPSSLQVAKPIMICLN